jgi:hypothetical protein
MFSRQKREADMSNMNILAIAISVSIIFGVVPALIVLWAKRHFARLEKQDRLEHYQELNKLYPHLFDEEIQRIS